MKLNDSNLFRQQALINGRWRDASSKETLAVTNPANGQQLAIAHDASQRRRGAGVNLVHAGGSPRRWVKWKDG